MQTFVRSAQRTSKWFIGFFLLVFFVGMSGESWGQTNHLVISQIYGGGGNTGATYKNDFVELFNPTSSSVSLTNWTLQYGSATGGYTGTISLTGSIAAGKYFLIALASGGTPGSTLPTADVTNTSVNMSATAGKVKLVNSSSSIIDLVGFGSNASEYEGTGPAVASTGNAFSFFRKNSGCTETDDNTADFSTATPAPRNSASAGNVCSVTPVAPTVTLTAASSITTTTATSGGNVTSTGNATLAHKGVVWSTTTGVTIGNATGTTDEIAAGTGTGTYTSSITGLTANTIYYYNAYATNSVGTGYGTEKNFTTVANAPGISGATAVTSTGFTANWTAPTGNGIITSYTLQYSTTSDFSSAITTVSGITGTSSAVSSLAPATTYYYRVLAINSGGSSTNSASTSVTTSNAAPAVTTTTATAITYNSATSGGTVTATNGAPVTAEGVVWSTIAAPTIALSTKTSDGTATPFTSSITGLAANTTYHYRAYATNTVGTSYGADLTFKTALAPALIASPTSLTFANTTVFNNSASQTVTLSGASLTGAPGTITITASSTDYQVSTDNVAFGATATINYTSATLSSTTFYVRFTPQSISLISGTITISGGSASTTVAVSGTGIACAAPATQATNIVFSNVAANSLTATWTVGNGVGSVAYISVDNNFTDPVNSTDLPTVNLVYSGSGQQAIYAGTGNTVNVSGLSASTVYYVRVYAYNNCSGTFTYQTSTATGNPNSIVTSSGTCTALLAEDFNYGTVANSNLLDVSNGNWVYLSGTNNPAKFNYSPSRGLVYPGYASGGVGGSANVIGSNGTDIYRVISGSGGLTSGAVYMSFLMNFTSITGADYFIPLKDNNTATNAYYAKLFAQPKSGSSTTYQLGLTKFAGTATNYTGTFNFGQTYLVVVKYQFNTGSTTNDVVAAWVFANGVPASEAAATPLISPFTDGLTDATNIYAVTMRQKSGNNGYIDGIRIGSSWADAVCTGPVTPITYTWQPTSGTANDFATSTNWSPVRSTIRNTDILSFTRGGASTATGVTAQGVGRINVDNSTSITLSSSGYAPVGINDDGTTTPDLSVAAGSSLILSSGNGASSIQLNLIQTATASISGNVTFSGTSPAPHRLTSETPSAITFASGSVFSAQKLLGSPFTNDSSYLPTTPNGVVFQSGSTYNFNDGSNPFGLTQPASAVVFNPGSTYKHLLGSTDPSFAGRTYGNFEYNPGNVVPNTATIITSTVAGNIQNNFTVTTGTLNFTAASQPINIGGNISVASGATLNYSPTSTTAATLSLNGTTAQTISGTGTFTLGSNSTLAINNSSGITLNRSVAVGGILALTSGVVTSSSSNLLSVTNTAAGAITGGSTTTYVSGPLQRTLPASLSASASVYNFPVGKGSVYLPLGLSSLSTTTSPTVTSEAFNGTAGGTAGATLCTLSGTEYWQATASSGYTDGKVSLTRQTALGSFNVIGRSTTQAGTYSSLNGTVSGTSILNSDATGSSLGYFVMAAQGITGLTYSTNPASYCAGSLITNNNPSFSTGAAVSYAITPALPAGLTLNTTTGVISGTPTTVTAATDYQVTATNAAGCSTTASVNIAVSPLPTATISGPSAVCFGSGSGVNISSSTGGTVYYHISNVTGEKNVVLAAGTGTNLTDVVTQPTTYTLDSVRIPGACLTLLSASVLVNVNPLPDAGTISGNTTSVGVGKNIKLSESVTGGTWSVTNAKATINSTTANPVTIHGVAVGTDTVYYSVTNVSTGCSNSTMQVVNVYDAANFLYVTKADGNFTNPATWKLSSDNGTTFTDATDAPNDSDNIQIKHNVILDTNYNGIATASLLINSRFNGTDSVRGTLTISPNHYLSSAGAVNFNSRHVTVKSDATGSGAIGKITNGTIAGADSVTVERYTQKKRAWRLITSPITNATINAGWQEGNLWDGVTPTKLPSTGYGTLITGYGQGMATNANSHGYDFWAAVASTTSSIRYYVPGPTGGSWGSSLPTISGVKIRDYPAYMLFVRGDRSISAITDTSATNLRATGTLQQGTATIGVIHGGYSTEVAGNPYASAIDFASVYSQNSYRIQNKFVAWVTRLGTYGAYTYVTSNGDGTYTATPTKLDGTPGTPVNPANDRYIQSGEGFLVYPFSSTATGNITVDETAKAPTQQATTVTNTFRLSPGTDRKLYANLNQKTSDTSANLTDGFLVRFDPSYTNDITDDDAGKPANFNENFGIMSHNTDLIVEARADVQKTDTVQVHMWNVTKRDYQLQILGDNWTSAPNVHAYLVDNYLATKQEVTLSGTVTSINFTVNTDSASWKSDRFSIVFQNSSAVLPVTLTSVKAAAQNGGVNVTWTVTNEQNIKTYTVERSINGGTSYTAIGSQAAKNTMAAAITNYQGFDAAPQMGSNLYRIRIETKEGVVTYSSVVTVVIGQDNGKILITLYPNPVRPNGKVSLQMSNLATGTYLVNVYSQAGQTVYQKKITIGQPNTTQSEELKLGGSLAQGSYELRITNKEGSIVYTNKLLVGK